VSAKQSGWIRDTAAPFAGIVDMATISPQTRMGTGRAQAPNVNRLCPRTVRDHVPSAHPGASTNSHYLRPGPNMASP